MHYHIQVHDIIHMILHMLYYDIKEIYYDIIEIYDIIVAQANDAQAYKSRFQLDVWGKMTGINTTQKPGLY